MFLMLHFIVYKYRVVIWQRMNRLNTYIRPYSTHFPKRKLSLKNSAGLRIKGTRIEEAVTWRVMGDDLSIGWWPGSVSSSEWDDLASLGTRFACCYEDLGFWRYFRSLLLCWWHNGLLHKIIMFWLLPSITLQAGLLCLHGVATKVCSVSPLPGCFLARRVPATTVLPTRTFFLSLLMQSCQKATQICQNMHD